MPVNGLGSVSGACKLDYWAGGAIVWRWLAFEHQSLEWGDQGLSGISVDRVKQILARIRECNILVIGDAMLDRYVWGLVSRISPEAPVPIVEIQTENSRLGGAANVANNVRSLGAACRIVSVIGKDGCGGEIESLMGSQGIDTSGIVYDAGRPTTVKTRVIAHNQQVVRTDREVRDEIAGATEDRIIDAALAGADACDAVIVSDYGKGVITKRLLKELIPRVRGRDKIISVDPKENHFRNYRQVSLITPNQYEAGAAMGKRIHDEVSLHEVGWEIVDLLEVDSLLITRGEQGMSLFRKDRTYRHFPTVARHVYDVTGAGDTVICSFTLALCAGATMEEAAEIANHAAGVVIGDVGTATVTPEQLISSFASEQL